MTGIDLLALLSFAGLVASWAILPSSGWRSAEAKSDQTRVGLTPAHES